MRILLSGAEGQLGQSFQKVFMQKHPLTKGIELIALSRKDLDITQKNHIESKFHEYQPDFFINAAAYTAVDSAEEYEDDAHAINAEALKSIGELCETLKIKALHVSTDYVFNGERTRPYTEDDLPAPINNYGKTKLLGERNLLETCSNSTILRTSWVFSEFGRNFLKTMLGLSSNKQELCIVDDQFGGPTYAPHIAQALLNLIQNYDQKDKGQVYHFSGSPFVSWYEFANVIFKLAEVSISTKRVKSNFFPTNAQRPKNSKLDSSKIFNRFHHLENNWEDGVKKSIKQIKKNTSLQ